VTTADLAGYVDRIEKGPYEWMFYVFHFGNAYTDATRVTVIGPTSLRRCDSLPEFRVNLNQLARDEALREETTQDA
jgi:hypothetical protein